MPELKIGGLPLNYDLDMDPDYWPDEAAQFRQSLAAQPGLTGDDLQGDAEIYTSVAAPDPIHVIRAEVRQDLAARCPQTPPEDIRQLCERVHLFKDHDGNARRLYLVVEKHELVCPDPGIETNLFISIEGKLVIPFPKGAEPLSLSTIYGGRQDSESMVKPGDAVVLSDVRLAGTLSTVLLRILDWKTDLPTSQLRKRIDDLLKGARAIGLTNVFPLRIDQLPLVFSPVEEGTTVESPGLWKVKTPRACSILPGPVAIDQTATAGSIKGGGVNMLLQRDTVFTFKLNEERRSIIEMGAPKCDTYDATQFLECYRGLNREQISRESIPAVVFDGAFRRKEPLIRELVKVLGEKGAVS